MTSVIPSLFFETFLIEKRIPYQIEPHANLVIYIIERTIRHGKYVGTTVTIGLPIPSDFEANPPYGLHIKKEHGVIQNITKSGVSLLGDQWEFWSRQVKNWDIAVNKSQYYLDHVDRWLEL